MSLFTPEAPSYWNTPSFKEGIGDYLREDLEILRQYLQETTDAEGLAVGLTRAGLKRVMEVGTYLDFEAIKELCALQIGERTLFRKEDIWAIDPNLWSDNELRFISRLDGFMDRFSRNQCRTEIIMANVQQGLLLPFDLVFAKGVASIGYLTGLDNEIEEWTEDGREIIRSMRDCLNPENPNALLMISTKYNDKVIPYCRQDLDKLGLETVYHEPANGRDAEQWIRIFKEFGHFPNDPDESFSRSVICKRK